MTHARRVFTCLFRTRVKVGVAVEDIKGQAHVAALQKLALKVIVEKP